VNVEQAEKAARSLARTIPKLTARKNFHLSRTISKPVQRNYPGLRSSVQEEEPVYYVFTMNDEEGFIVISGDDAAKPVLGYSDTGTFDESNPNLAYWMGTLAQEITAAIENDFPQDAQTRAAWDALDSGNTLLSGTSGDFVDPLVKTKWGQDAPYNKFCPKHGTKTTLVGCVATAIAQIMNYHKYPATRTVPIPGYSSGFSIQAITGTTTYDWNNMAATYTSTSGTEAQKNAVATLMYQVGVGVKMSYGVTASGAYSTEVSPALKNYFGYDAGISYHLRNYFSYADWINLLKTELRANRPVYYSGFGKTSGGHAFVCDGYDTEGLFHFNWGWNGSSDGYFAVSALYPGGYGESTGGFNDNQDIITAIQPPTGSVKQPSIQLGLLDSVSAEWNKPHITVKANLRNTGADHITEVYLGVLLYKQDNTLHSSSANEKTVNLSPAAHTSWTHTYTLPSDLPAGIYRLYPACGNSSETLAIIPGNSGNRYIEVTVGSNGNVSVSSVIDRPKLTLNWLKPAGNLSLNAPVNFEAEISNSGTADYYSFISFKLGNSTSVVPVIIPAGVTKTVELSRNGSLLPGNYQLSVWYDPNNTFPEPSSAHVSVQLGEHNELTVLPESQSAPVGVELSSKTSEGVILKNIADAKYAKALSTKAPAIPGGAWQDTPVFSNLTPNTKYYFFAYYPETATRLASVASPGLQVITDKAALGGEATISGSPIFGGTLTAETSKLTATPDVSQGTLSFRWKRDSEIISNATGNTYKLVQADIDKTISVTVTAENCSGSVSSAATNPVIKATQSLPAAPVAENVTATSITLSAIAGMEYCREDTEWQESPVFNNLSPNTYYTFFARLKESATHRASPASWAIIRTNPAEITINSQLEDMMFADGEVNGNLCVTSTVTGGATLNYQWYGNTVESNEGGVAVAGATDACFAIPDTLVAGTYYYYCTVSATDGATPVASRVATVTVKTAIPDVANDSTAEFYPNPFTDELHIKDAEGCTLRIFSPVGLLIHIRKVTTSDEIIHLKHLRRGVYLFRLDRDEKTKAAWGIKI
jgi:hypothetical protein